MMLDATQNYDQPLTRTAVWMARRAVSHGTERHDPDHCRGLARGSSGPMQVVSGPIGREKFTTKRRSRAASEEMQAFLDWFDSENDIDPSHAASHIFGLSRFTRLTTAMAVSRAPSPTWRLHARKIARSVLQHVRADPDRTESLLRYAGGDAEGRPRHYRMAGMVSRLSGSRLR